MQGLGATDRATRSCETRGGATGFDTGMVRTSQLRYASLRSSRPYLITALVLAVFVSACAPSATGRAPT